MLEVETEVETVTIGKYNKAKDIVVVAADSIRHVRRSRAGLLGRRRVIQRIDDRLDRPR